MIDVQERSALITGASRGIGLQIAKQLAIQGFRLTITARDIDSLDVIAPTLTALGSPHVATVAADMAEPDSLPNVVAKHHDANRDISALILSAGVGSAGEIGDYPMRRLDKTIAVNFRAPFQLIQLALPALRASARRHPESGAKIIVLSSITGVYAESGLAAYGASKAATLSLVDTINAEQSAYGVSATAVAPAYVDTEMSAWAHDRIPPESMIPAEDIGILVGSLVTLSSRSAVGRIVVARAGGDSYRP